MPSLPAFLLNKWTYIALGALFVFIAVGYGLHEVYLAGGNACRAAQGTAQVEKDIQDHNQDAQIDTKAPNVSNTSAVDKRLLKRTSNR